MLSLKRHLGESIEIGPARVTLCGYRRKGLELLIVIGKEVSRTTIPHGHDIDINIDGANVVIGYQPDSDYRRRCHTLFVIYVAAPRHLKILRTEIADEIARQKHGQSIKGLAYVE